MLKVINMCAYKMSSSFADFIGIRSMNCYVIYRLIYSCHFTWEEIYISSILLFLLCQYSCLQMHEYHRCSFECKVNID